MGFPAESLDEIIIVKEGDCLRAIYRNRLEDNQEALEILENPAEALAKLSEQDASRLRKEIALLLSPAKTERPFFHAKNSPLPLIQYTRFNPSNDNHDLLALKHRLEGVHWLAMLDGDNTLFQAESEHTIMLHHFAKFLKERFAADFSDKASNLAALTELIAFCDKWEGQRYLASHNLPLNLERKDDYIEYEQGIEQSGHLSALAFKGFHIEKLKEYGREYFEEVGLNLFDYTPAILQKLRDHGILPVLVTGAPDFLVPAILEHIGTMAHGNGMTYEMNKDGILTGKVENNLGLAVNKGKQGEKYKKIGYAVPLAGGDSEGDMGSVTSAVFTSPADKQDVHGGAVVANASEEAVRAMERPYNICIGDSVIVVPRKKNEAFSDPTRVKTAFGEVLHKIFYPLHEYAEIKRDTENPERLKEFLEYLAEAEDAENGEEIGDNKDGIYEGNDNLKALVAFMKASPEIKEGTRNKKLKNLRNLEFVKRIRDVLRAEGLNEKQITAQLLGFYPEIIVKAVMKDYMLDTRNEDDVEDFVARRDDIVYTRDQESIGAWLVRIGASREAMENVLTRNKKFQEESCPLPIPVRRSTFPPPPKPAEADKKTDGKDDEDAKTVES